MDVGFHTSSSGSFFISDSSQPAAVKRLIRERTLRQRPLATKAVKPTITDKTPSVSVLDRKMKCQMIRESRDYSFLFGPDSELPAPPAKRPKLGDNLSKQVHTSIEPKYIHAIKDSGVHDTFKKNSAPKNQPPSLKDLHGSHRHKPSIQRPAVANKNLGQEEFYGESNKSKAMENQLQQAVANKNFGQEEVYAELNKLKAVQNQLQSSSRHHAPDEKKASLSYSQPGAEPQLEQPKKPLIIRIKLRPNHQILSRSGALGPELQQPPTGQRMGKPKIIKRQEVKPTTGHGVGKPKLIQRHEAPTRQGMGKPKLIQRHAAPTGQDIGKPKLIQGHEASTGHDMGKLKLIQRHEAPTRQGMGKPKLIQRHAAPTGQDIGKPKLIQGHEASTGHDMGKLKLIQRHESPIGHGLGKPKLIQIHEPPTQHGMGKPKLIQRHENLQPPTGKRMGKPIIVQKHELKRSRPSIVDEEYIESQMNSILQKIVRNSYMKAGYNDGDIE
ncbi:uncharacterized protein LOC110814976 isoform X2 [Carica papaya]|uniref:uncharacterized protein LOC110814976 isoform X2 n=1 Tax=Carica papaya TaxID=3649 RepID=UPI000B8CC9E0|nr:uncharacterized protein LOC110814976 isoform X2 [Carica papaya]XP_021898268.1 uncharacterized protein LOC110814976 isoform X2 [Carica papaya]